MAAKIAKMEEYSAPGGFYDDYNEDEEDGVVNGGGAVDDGRTIISPTNNNGSNPNIACNGDRPLQPRQRRKVPEGELCAVCSDRATGYHYGVASCNGCKTFFRRTIVSGHTFHCQYNGNCDVNKNVRCACRHCRFNKCVAVGMDDQAIQNDRDRIGPTKKFRLGNKRTSSTADDDQISLSSLSPPMQQQQQRTIALSGGGGLPLTTIDERVLEHLLASENLCNILRNRQLPECKSVRETLQQPSLLHQAESTPIDNDTQFKELYPASMNDIQMWNIRELRLCLEWAKTFEEFARLSDDDQFHLVRNFAFTFNILNRVFYSLDHGPDKIVYQNGAFILRSPQEQVRIPGCRSIYHRQMDEIMQPFRKLEVSISEFAAFKACLLFNPDACEMSSPNVREDISRERTKYLSVLFYLITNKYGMAIGIQKYGNMLLMAASIQNIIDQNDENMQVMEVFGHFWRINGFVKELCMK